MPREYAELTALMDEAGAAVTSEDPYAVAAGHDHRAHMYAWMWWYASPEDGLFQGTCIRAEAEEKRNAARIRFAHGIPTMTPNTEAARLGLQVCGACGRAWQTTTEGACEKCPRLRFDPTPHTSEKAARHPEPEIVDGGSAW